MGSIEVGTASWTDKSLIASKKFYPKGCNTAEARLRYYASVFPMVEVDSSYYALPSESNSRLWLERTPPGFEFNIKAFRLFTGHQTPAQALPNDIKEQLGAHFARERTLYYRDTPAEIRDELWDRYERAIRPLHEAGRLVAVHFQFPHWVLPSRRALDHILECQSRLAGYHLAIEFRRDLWFDEAHLDATLGFLREHDLTHVVVDAPSDKATAVPRIWAATSPKLAIVRFHGRNDETWDRKDLKSSAERFDYDYDDPQLAEFVAPIRQLAGEVLKVQAIFNNNMEDQGQRNARTLSRLLQDAEDAQAAAS